MASFLDRYVAVDHAMLSKPKVRFMRAENGWSELEIAGAILHWFIHVSQLQCDRLEYTSHKTVDDIAKLDGFASAMESVGWIRFEDTDCVVVDFDDRFSIRAKRRAHDAARREANRENSKSLSDKECPQNRANRPKNRATEHNTTLQDKNIPNNDNNTGGAVAPSGGVVVSGDAPTVGGVAESLAGATGPLTPAERADIRGAIVGIGVSPGTATGIAADPNLERTQVAWALVECLSAERPPAWIAQALREHWQPPNKGSPSERRDSEQRAKTDAVRQRMEDER